MMKALNTMKVAFPSRSANEGFARSVVAAFAAQADPTMGGRHAAHCRHG